MPYNPQTDATLGWVSKRHEAMLQELRMAHGRTKRAELEKLIELAYAELKTPQD